MIYTFAKSCHRLSLHSCCLAFSEIKTTGWEWMLSDCLLLMLLIFRWLHITFIVFLFSVLGILPLKMQFQRRVSDTEVATEAVVDVYVVNLLDVVCKLIDEWCCCSNAFLDQVWLQAIQYSVASSVVIMTGSIRFRWEEKLWMLIQMIKTDWLVKNVTNNNLSKFLQWSVYLFTPVGSGVNNGNQKYGTDMWNIYW